LSQATKIPVRLDELPGADAAPRPRTTSRNLSAAESATHHHFVAATTILVPASLRSAVLPLEGIHFRAGDPDQPRRAIGRRLRRWGSLKLLPYPLLLLLIVGISILATLLLSGIAGIRTQDPSVAIMLLMTTYWTLVGAIPVILSKWAAPSGLYSYLESRLFRLRLDNSYGVVILAYSVFLICVSGIVVCLGRTTTVNDRRRSDDRWARLSALFSHGLLLSILTAIFLLKLALVLVLIRNTEGSSIYTATRIVRGSLGPLIRIYQYLNIALSYPLACGLALWLAFPASRAVHRRAYRRLVWAVYLFLALVGLIENSLLGNRATPLIMMAAVTSGWLRWRYVPAERRQRRGMRRNLFALGLLGLALLGTIGISRGGELNSPAAVATSLADNASRIGNVAIQEVRSSEKLAAHMSLYAIVEDKARIPDPKLGDSYGEYARLVFAPKDQVFTLHYVTSWWLRMGAVGVLAATLTFGLAVVLLHRLGTGRVTLNTAGLRLAAATLPAAALPIIVIRGGPESLRSVIVEILLIPAIILTPCFVLAGSSPDVT